MPKNDLYLDRPLMNAAGTLGFSPDLKSPVEVSWFGAFVTNPVSLQPRTPAKGERFIQFPGGFLLHTGYPNPGLNAVISQHARRWARSPVPVIVHLLAQDTDSVGRMVQRLEGVEGVIGIEIGLPPDIDLETAYEMALASIGELALIVRVPFERCLELAEIMAEVGISAISLSAPRGTLPAKDGGLISGRLYGPGMFPQSLSAVKKLVELEIPVIGAGGVYSKMDADAMLAAGAVGVQVDAALWRGEFSPLLSTR